MSHVVVAPAIQLRVGARAHFLERGALLPADTDEADLDRLVAEKLIEEVVDVEPGEVVVTATFSQEQLDAAVIAAVEAKDAELAEARKQLDADIAAFEKSKADAEKAAAPAAKAPAAKKS